MTLDPIMSSSQPSEELDKSLRSVSLHISVYSYVYQPVALRLREPPLRHRAFCTALPSTAVLIYSIIQGKLVTL